MKIAVLLIGLVAFAHANVNTETKTEDGPAIAVELPAQLADELDSAPLVVDEPIAAGEDLVRDKRTLLLKKKLLLAKVGLLG